MQKFYSFILLFLFLFLFKKNLSFYSYRIAAKIYPEMSLDALFTANTMEDTLRIDSLPQSTRSLMRYEEEPSAVRLLFDDIAYNKCK
jgi:hypothetical protein